MSTRAQKYAVSTSQLLRNVGTAAPAPTAISNAATGSRAPPRRNTAHTAKPRATRNTPTPTRITVEASVATNKKPDTNVPTMAPAVPSAEIRPTSRPVCSRSRSDSFTRIGDTIDNTAAGSKNAAPANNTAPAAPPSPETVATRCRAGDDAMTRAPPAMSTGPSSHPGSNRSAIRPPSHVPPEIPASTTPMMAVYVCNVTPTYGARSLDATISITSTDPAVTNASAPAAHRCMP